MVMRERIFLVRVGVLSAAFSFLFLLLLAREVRLGSPILTVEDLAESRGVLGTGEVSTMVWSTTTTVSAVLAPMVGAGV